MISILCSFVNMQSFLMPWNDSDDGYLAIFLRQLSRRGLLLFLSSQKVDGARHAPLSLFSGGLTKNVPTRWNATVALLASWKIITNLSHNDGCKKWYRKKREREQQYFTEKRFKNIFYYIVYCVYVASMQWIFTK